MQFYLKICAFNPISIAFLCTIAKCLLCFLYCFFIHSIILYCLFSGEGRFPGVLDLFGGAGGLLEFRASLLASHGFASLALAYFGYDDLPAHLDKVDLDYFEEAADFLLRHPKVIFVSKFTLSLVLK